MPDSIRRKWFQCLNEPSASYWPSIFVTALITLVIVLNIIEVILSSMKDYTSLAGDGLVYISYGFALFFTFEYILRVWVAPEAIHERLTSNWQKRWHYMSSPMGIIDLLSSLPLLIWMFLPTDQFSDFRILKLISMIRVFKLTRYSSSLSMLARVYSENRHTLFAAALVMMILMILSAAGIYVFERSVQPDDFGSIPSSMWWAFVTLTTVGYGDVTPITLGGKIFGSVVMVCGVGIAAMPAGIFASSFVQLVREQEQERRQANRFRRSSINAANKSSMHENEHHSLGLHMTKSEQNEVKYLIAEYNLTLEQAVGVVSHFRHGN
jgi:voltage-gated potassium channel